MTRIRRCRACRRVARMTARLPWCRATLSPARAAGAPDAPTGPPARGRATPRATRARARWRTAERSSDLTAGRAERDHDNGRPAQQQAEHGRAERRRRPEREPRHEAALPAFGPLADRNLE